jgi:hypothetical protein
MVLGAWFVVKLACEQENEKAGKGENEGRGGIFGAAGLVSERAVATRLSFREQGLSQMIFAAFTG